MSLRRWVVSAAEDGAAARYLASLSGIGFVSFGELAERCRLVDERLSELGLGPGAPVLICESDPLEYASSLVSIVASGRVAVPVDPKAPARSLTAVRRSAGPRALAANGDLVSLPASVAPSRLERAAAGQGGIYLLTSGTTGEPKGVYLSEAKLCHVASAVASHHELSPREQGLSLLPLFHVNAEVVAVLASLKAGSTLYLTDHFHRTGFWEAVARLEITWVNAAPAIISILSLGEAPPLTKVRFFRSASAPLPVAVKDRFEALSGIPVLESYGMTEAASMIAANPLSGGKPGSVGLPVSTEVRLRRENLVVGPGEVGDIEIRGAGVITSYAVGGDASFTEDGWLKTGDVGVLDDDGYLFLLGRNDDVINRGGEKLYPREVEEVLMAHASVLAAVVVAAPDPVLTERPVAYVVAALRTGDERARSALRDELRAACSDRLSSYKVPHEITMVDSLPLGSTGKVSRRRLAEMSAL